MHPLERTFINKPLKNNSYATVILTVGIKKIDTFAESRFNRLYSQQFLYSDREVSFQRSDPLVVGMPLISKDHQPKADSFYQFL